MPDDWKRKFTQPVFLADGTALKTLDDARTWLLLENDGRPEFGIAAGRLMEAARGGSMKEARETVHLAAFVTMQLDFKRKRP